MAGSDTCLTSSFVRSMRNMPSLRTTTSASSLVTPRRAEAHVRTHDTRIVCSSVLGLGPALGDADAAAPPPPPPDSVTEAPKLGEFGELAPSSLAPAMFTRRLAPAAALSKKDMADGGRLWIGWEERRFDSMQN
jgi:hypothetical protein